MSAVDSQRKSDEHLNLQDAGRRAGLDPQDAGRRAGLDPQDAGRQAVNQNCGQRVCSLKST